MVSHRLASQARQAELVDAALTLAARGHPADVTTAALAAAVGITQGAVFRHFDSKEAIWLAVIDQVHARLMARLQLASRHDSQPLQALRAVFLAHVDFVLEHPGVPRVIFQELQQAGDTALKARVRRLMGDYRQLLMRLLLQARDATSLAPQVDLEAAITLFIGTVQGLVMQSMLAGDIATLRAQAPRVFTLYLGGVAADGGGAIGNSSPDGRSSQESRA